MLKRVLLILAIILAVFLGLLLIKGLSNEDDWICQNGQWLKHGKPRAPKPTVPCR